MRTRVVLRVLRPIPGIDAKPGDRIIVRPKSADPDGCVLVMRDVVGIAAIAQLMAHMDAIAFDGVVDEEPDVCLQLVPASKHTKEAK